MVIHSTVGMLITLVSLYLAAESEVMNDERSYSVLY